jgi:acyl-coenzyme A thioesterase PaaI-like protein
MTTTTLDTAAGAVARFDADLAAAAATAELQALRRRAVEVYRSAIVYAAGKPDDPHWRLLVRTVAAFASRVPPGKRSHQTAAALARLNALVEENLG